ITLSRCDGRKWWVMCCHEAVVGVLMRFQILFDPPQLLRPKRSSSLIIRRGSRKLAIDNRKVTVAPVEGIVRSTFIKDIVDIVGRALMISDRRKKRRLTQQFLFDAEKSQPLSGGISVLDHVAGLDDEIRYRALHDLSHDPLMHIVAGPVVAIDHKA